MLKIVVRNTSYLLIASIGQKILAFLYFTLLARTLGPNATGQYMLALSFTALFAVALDMGLSPVLTRETAKRHAAIFPILQHILRLKLVVACAVVPLVIIVGSLVGYPYQVLFLITLAALVMVGDSLHLTLYALLRGLQRFQYEARGVVVGKVLILLLGIPLIVVRAPLPYLIAPLGLATLFNIFYAWWVVNRIALARPRAQRHDSAESPAQGEALQKGPSLSSFLRQGLPFTLASLFTTAWISMDSVLLGFFQGPAAVGLWSVPMKLAFALQFIPSALSVSLYPAIASLFIPSPFTGEGHSPVGDVATSGEGITRISQAFQKSIRYLWLLAFPISLCTILLAPKIIQSVYGDQYLLAIPALQLAIAFLPFYFVNLQLGSLLAGTHRQSLHAKLVGLAAATSIGINLVLIPTYGILSAAFAMLVSSLVFFIGGIIVMRRILSIPWSFYGMVVLRIVCACLLMGFVVVGIRNLVPLVVTVLLGGGAYGIALLILKEITVQEITVVVKKLQGMYSRS